MKRFIRIIIHKLLLFKRHRGNRRMFERYFNKIINLNSIEWDSTYDEDYKRWVKKWGVFGYKPTPLGWRAFVKDMNGNVNFVPNDVARNFIEPILTPEPYQPFYNDKNSFGLFIDKRLMPKTYLRSMNGIIYNGDYESVSSDNFIELFDNADKLVVKPAKDMGGKGVTLFQRNGDKYVDPDGNVLSLAYLQKVYNTDYLIQECLKQSEYMSQFNPSSVNTLRIASYRNVKTGKIDVIGAVLRIGGKGSFVDNACSGGSFVYVDKDGRLGKYACDEYGRKQTIYNDIDFVSSEFIIPNFEKIKQCVCDVAKKMPHMSLFANDVAIDSEGNPRIIEVNTIQFSYWLYQFNGKAVFDQYTDDLIEHCLKENKKIRPSIFLKYN